MDDHFAFLAKLHAPLTAWAVVRAGKFQRNVCTGLEAATMPAIYSTRRAARHFRTRNIGERVVKVRITVM